ncbi:hypothetical protein GJ496_009802 [Pomphorhynchus laevis]|nr:hypothetical protein GJ496_009802 [Pomphorhynchus laevis]
MGCCFSKHVKLNAIKKIKSFDISENAANSISDKDDTYHLSWSSTDVSLKELDQLQVGTYGLKMSLTKNKQTPNLRVVKLLNSISKVCQSVQLQLRFTAVKPDSHNSK